MTALAVLLRIIAGVDLPGMKIFMAVAAPLAHRPELPTLPALVAGEAGGGQVGPFEGKRSGLVALDAEGRPGKSLHAVALPAVGHRTFTHEISLVIILMAIRAAGKGQGIRQLPLMAVGTAHPLMTPLQRKTGAAMVEAALPFHQGKRFL